MRGIFISYLCAQIIQRYDFDSAKIRKKEKKNRPRRRRWLERNELKGQPRIVDSSCLSIQEHKNPWDDYSNAWANHGMTITLSFGNTRLCFHQDATMYENPESGDPEGTFELVFVSCPISTHSRVTPGFLGG